MKKFLVLILLLNAIHVSLHAQEILPGISVKNIGGKIIVSWKNEYQKPVSTINIQRSYDSLQNYTTIGSVLNPQSPENGYADATAPYNKMYYRVFIAFEGGAYIISQPVRPTKDTSTQTGNTVVRYPWQVDPNADPNIQLPPVTPTPTPGQPTSTTPPVWMPSKMVFTARDNNVIIHLPEVETKKYVVKFFDENDNKLFELTNLKDDYLIVERVNFKRSGWYHFEIWDNGSVVEKNKFFIAKDGKVTNDTPKRYGNR
ncbi:MAG: hypothetical protein QM687_11170 [Ferruginibacter sp.]